MDQYNSIFKYIFKITIISMFVSLCIVLRYILIFLPNVELITFLLMMSVIVFQWKTSILIINCFCFSQVVLFSFIDLPYFYIFNLYWLITFIFRKMILKFWYILPILLFFYGLAFGLLYSLEMWLLYSLPFAISYWITGLIFDITHAISSMIFGFLFYIPVIKTMKMLSINKTFLFDDYFLDKYSF